MTVTIPLNQSKTASLKAFDGSNPPVDVSSTGTFTAVSSNPAAVTVAAGVTGAQFTITAVGQGSAQITYTFTNPSGTATDVDTINPPDPPVSVTSTYA